MTDHITDFIARHGLTGRTYDIWFESGWVKLLDRCVNELKAAGWDGVVTQIKEKFGGLRFYIENGDATLWKIIQQYEVYSLACCEQCGEIGGPVNNKGWLKTLCSAHRICKEP